MKLPLPERFILFDLEYTAWKGSKERDWRGPNEYKEVIQIGAVRVSKMAELASLCVYVQPVKNSHLSEYITDLTGISQGDIDQKGITFQKAIDQFLQFVGNDTAYCWGSDTEILEGNAALLGGLLRLSKEQFKDLRPVVSPFLQKSGIDIEEYSSGTLIRAFGKVPARPAHNAVNDMRNLLDALLVLESQSLRAEMSS